MKKVLLSLAVFISCTPKARVDDLAFKFCDKVTSNKSEYLKCFTDIVECHNKSFKEFDADLKFIECARLFQVQEPSTQPFKYVPSMSDTKIDEDIWRELENLDMSDSKRKKPKPRSEPKTETAKVETKPKEEKKKETPYNYDEKKTPSEAPEGVARKLPTETKWSKPVEDKTDWPTGDLDSKPKEQKSDEFQW